MAADLEFRIGAELSEIKAALAGLQRDFSAVGAAANKAGGNQAFAGLERGVTGAIGLVKNLAAAWVAVQTAMQFVGKADEINTLNARLKLATRSTEEFARAQSELFDMAQRTRSSLSGTITLYSQIAQATKDAGVGQETLLGIVETINQAVQLSGASAQAAEAALVQLGQGLASGTLRGEELNSILEQTPALADAIAKGMGITRGQLRKYGEDGKITAEQVIKALRAQKDEVAQQFAQLPLTVGQAVTTLSNAGQQLLGVFDTATGATSGLAEAIKGLADYLSSDEVAGAVVEFAKLWSGAIADMANDFVAAVDIVKGSTADMVGTGEGAVQLFVRAFNELPRNIRTVVRIVAITVSGMVDAFVADAVLMKEALAAVFTDDTIEAAIARRNAKVNAAGEAVRAMIDEEIAANRAAVEDAKKAGADAIKAREKARQTRTGTGTGRFTTTPSAADLQKAQALRKAQLDAEEKLEDDSAKRKLGIIQQLYDDAQLATRDYIAMREAIELAAVDRSIALERQRAKAGGAEQVKALAEIEILERRKTDIARQGEIDRKKAARDLDRQLEQLRAQDLENAGQAGEAARIRAEAQFRDLLARLTAEGNVEGVKLIQKLIDVEAARGQFNQLKAEFDRVQTDLQARVQQLADQRDTGGISADTAAQGQAEARAQAIEQLTQLNAKLQELAQRTNDPTIVAGANQAAEALRRLGMDSMTGIDAAVRDLRASWAQLQQDFEKSVTSAGVDALTTLFTDLASGSKSAGQAIADFARSFVASMAQIAARAMATYLVLQLLDAVFPGAGKLVAASGNIGASVKHGGGMAGQGAKRMVNPLLFAGAPRFHSGSGVLGLKPGEIPAILQEGERVQSRQEVAASRQGSGAGNGTRILNVIDPSLVSDYLESAAGEKTVLNVISRNPGAVKQILA